MRLRPAILTLALALAGGAAHADEGMWMPSQLPQLAKELKAAGFKGNPADLADLTKPPMSAVVSLGGCTASFVSPQGLVVTNHHCAYGAIQLNSTPQDNLIEKGFIAASQDKELSAGPGARIYVPSASIASPIASSPMPAARPGRRISTPWTRPARRSWPNASRTPAIAAASPTCTTAPISTGSSSWK